MKLLTRTVIIGRLLVLVLACNVPLLVIADPNKYIKMSTAQHNEEITTKSRLSLNKIGSKENNDMVIYEYKDNNGIIVISNKPHRNSTIVQLPKDEIKQLAYPENNLSYNNLQTNNDRENVSYSNTEHPVSIEFVNLKEKKFPQPIAYTNRSWVNPLDNQYSNLEKASKISKIKRSQRMTILKQELTIEQDTVQRAQQQLAKLEQDNKRSEPQNQNIKYDATTSDKINSLNNTIKEYQKNIALLTKTINDN